MKFSVTEFIFLPLFVFASASFLLFVAGSFRSFAGGTMVMLLRYTGWSGGILFVYSILISILSIFRAKARIAAFVPKRTGAALLCGVLGGLYAFLAVIIMNVTKGNTP